MNNILDSIKETAIKELGIKNPSKFEKQLDNLSKDVLKRKDILKQMNKPGKKNIEDLREKYYLVTDSITKNIKEINGLI